MKALPVSIVNLPLPPVFVRDGVAHGILGVDHEVENRASIWLGSTSTCTVRHLTILRSMFSPSVAPEELTFRRSAD